MARTVCFQVILASISSLAICVPPAGGADLSFRPVVISNDANLWWARALGDLNGDGVLDIALQNNNGHGGWLGWLEAKNKGTSWRLHVIAERSPKDETFACGDMDIGDIDNDGDLDILGFEHPGEWDDGGAPTAIYWYENPVWKPRAIGQAPDFIKDLNLIDFNRDGRLDLVTITYQENTMTIFRQDAPASWTKAREFVVPNLHEGMDVGDIDGDGDPDVAADGYWMENPGGDLTDHWKLRSIDDKWHNQTGDWSKNATKVFCRDITGDGRVEVFISHSERKGYPVAWYGSDNPRDGSWTEHIIVEDLPAAHTLQVFDMDRDGDFDVLAGINKNRAKALGVETWPVVIYLNQGDNLTWRPHLITDQGIYNGQVADVDGDGDNDVLRLPTHDDKRFEVLLNSGVAL